MKRKTHLFKFFNEPLIVGHCSGEGGIVITFDFLDDNRKRSQELDDVADQGPFVFGQEVRLQSVVDVTVVLQDLLEFKVPLERIKSR